MSVSELFHYLHQILYALSDNINKSSPTTGSFATDNPPSVCKEPSVVDVASVVSSVIILLDTVSKP